MTEIVQLVVSFVLLLTSYFIYSLVKTVKHTLRKETSRAGSETLYQKELLKWLSLRNQGKQTADFLKEKNIKSLSIYGAGDAGRILMDELSSSGCRVNRIIDRNHQLLGDLSFGVKVVLPTRRDDYGDAIVISVLRDNDTAIKNQLKSIGINVPAFTLRDILAYLTVT